MDQIQISFNFPVPNLLHSVHMVHSKCLFEIYEESAQDELLKYSFATHVHNIQKGGSSGSFVYYTLVYISHMGIPEEINKLYSILSVYFHTTSPAFL